MIVDDEPDVLTSLKTILEHNEFDVTTVDNGKDCLKELENGFKGIILPEKNAKEASIVMDIMMPGMTGWDTIREIVSKGYIKDVAIEVVTGMGIKDHQRMGVLEPYIYDYLAKPINIEELISSIIRCNSYLYAKNNSNEKFNNKEYKKKD